MFQSLSRFEKFQPGARLWCMFYEPERGLFKEINWRTGFLLKDLHDKSHLSCPLLLDTQRIFPNLCLLCLPLKEESWISDIFAFWRGMNRPALRVFIPLKHDKKKLEENWPQKDIPRNSSCYAALV